VRYLLDTNVLSELRKGPRGHPYVTAWFAPIPDHAIYLSVLVIGEIRRGIERIRSRDPSSATTLDDWLMQVITSHHGCILAVDDTVAEAWGRMTASRPFSTVDSLLAATAKVHGLTLVTRNVTDIAATGVAYLNPFEPPPGPVLRDLSPMFMREPWVGGYVRTSRGIVRGKTLSSQKVT
jgi:toxin FitB